MQRQQPLILIKNQSFCPANVMSGTVSPFRAEQGTSLETPSRGPQSSYFSSPLMGTVSSSLYCHLPWLSQPQLIPAVPPPGLRLMLETTNGLLLPLVVYEPSWEEEPMSEPPAWFNRFLQMHMPPWFQMPAHASSLKFMSKGQFPEARAGEVGEILCCCESG